MMREHYEKRDEKRGGGILAQMSEEDARALQEHLDHLEDSE
jgi:hypothetical protein